LACGKKAKQQKAFTVKALCIKCGKEIFAVIAQDPNKDPVPVFVDMETVNVLVPLMDKENICETRLAVIPHKCKEMLNGEKEDESGSDS
jgi:hypothetical protein